MSKYILTVVLAVCLSGCATQQKFGNFSTNQQDITSVLVSDATKQLASLYPPASTRFALRQQIAKNDTFGNTLVDMLRSQGYAVQTYQPKEQISDGMTFNYVIDNPIKGDHGLYRVKLLAGPDILSRAYIDNGTGVLVPTGTWARMEGGQ